MLRQNRVRIDLEAIRNNFRVLKRHVPSSVAVMPVIKANAYGHGMLEVAQCLAQIGAEHFAVALPDEGIELRLGGIEGEILVLGACMPRAIHDCIAYGLTQTVFRPETVRLLESSAIAQGREAWVHIKLDTGMNRIGLKTEEEADALAQALRDCPHVKATGIYTHFADADADDARELNAFSHEQLERFEALRRRFDPSIPPHAANSAASLLAPETYFSMIREGIALYGYPPVHSDLPFQSALRWQTEVVNVKSISAGESVGYGRTFVAHRDMRIATVAVGYGDGYHRALSNKGQMLIRGQRVPIIGRVCMDQTMVDVSHLPKVEVGDEVVLLGRQQDACIGADELASWAETISYEVILSIASRVPREYMHV